MASATHLLADLPAWCGWSFAAVAAIAAMVDAITEKIPNMITIPTLVAALASVAIFAGGGALLQATGGIGVAVAIFFPLFVLGVFGAGDGKLVIALSPLLGARGTLELALVSLVIGAVGAFVLLVRHGRVKVFFKELALFFRSLVVPGLELHRPRLRRDIRAPFGVAIFFAFVVQLTQGGVW